MQFGRRPSGTILVSALLLLLGVLAGSITLRRAAPVAAQTGDGYDITWWTVDGGGGRVTGGDYALTGTAGQPDTGAPTGGYTLLAGFWDGGPRQFRIYLPLVLRDYP
jgi:hypothetical protein